MANILFLSSEMVPFCKTGGLADVAGSLPIALAREGHDVKSVLPYYGIIQHGADQHSHFHVHVKGMKVDGRFFVNRERGVPCYLVDQPHYFDRNGIYGDQFGDFGDNDERYAYFCEAALLLCKIEQWKPDIIHINDWQTGILAPILRLKYGSDPFFAGTKILFTIHNLAYQGCFDGGCYQKFDLPDEVMRFDGMEFFGSASFLKAGLQYSDVITAVSPTYAREIQTPEFGFGMDEVIRGRADRLVGVLNGVDTDDWNPQTDPYLNGLNYSMMNLYRKEEFKRNFLNAVGLPYWEHVPLFGMVTRFTAQKGTSLLEEAAEEMLQMGCQMVLLGTGDAGFEHSLRYFEEKYPKQVRAFITFDVGLSHQIQAASDFFMMPSRFEPCGLTQMYSLRYGTLPIVYHTGGLADTVWDCDVHPETGNGYVFYEYNRGSFLKTVRRALGLFHDRGVLDIVRKRGMSLDFSWSKAAKSYGMIYDYLMHN
jgi:starch synthase